MEGLEEFFFDEHILRINDLTPRIEGIQKFLSSLQSFPIRFLFRRKLERLQLHQEYSYKRFDNVRNFMIATSNNSRNKVVYDSEINKVLIAGSGSETFKCNGTPVFYHTEKGEEALLPVRIGIDEAILRIHRHPQREITPFDDFLIEYSFEAHFSLGNKYSGVFTKDQTSTRKTFFQDIMSLPGDSDKVFCGTPGIVFYRLGDRLYKGLQEAIFGNYCGKGNIPNDRISGRPNLRLYGDISIKDSGLLYQGDFECYNTSFPFFVRGSNNGNREKSPNPNVDVALK